MTRFDHFTQLIDHRYGDRLDPASRSAIATGEDRYVLAIAYRDVPREYRQVSDRTVELRSFATEDAARADITTELAIWGSDVETFLDEARIVDLDTGAVTVAEPAVVAFTSL